MQFNKLIIQLILLNAIKLIGSAGAPTDSELGAGAKLGDDTSSFELELQSDDEAAADAIANEHVPLDLQQLPHHHPHHLHHSNSNNHHHHHPALPSKTLEKRRGDYYDYRHVVAEGVQKALDECREKFKWDRWNCPKKAFLDILDRNPLPANKELGLTRALIASGIVLALTRTCSYGTNQLCGCTQPSPNVLAARTSALWPASRSTGTDDPVVSTGGLQAAMDSLEVGNKPITTGSNNDSIDSSSDKFVWKGCDEIVKFAFKVSKMYLEAQDQLQDEASRRINAHNYEVGRLAVKKNMRKVCKCHGVSGSCQVNTCWTTVPDMSKVGEYLKKQYRQAAKVGANSDVEETNVDGLKKELMAIQSDKLVFAEASPDYCYENPKLGINGTLNRYCSRTKHRSDGSLVSRSERDSCDRLCTKCGYRVKRERFQSEKQCDCRFIYCCSVECKRCPHVEDTYRCVRHS